MTGSGARWQAERISPDVLTLRFDGISAGWEQWFMLSSDRHWDSTLSDHALQETHLEQAIDRGALVLDFGDALDVMQSPQDKRQSKTELDTADKSTAYLDSVVSRFGGWAGTWADRWLLLAQGNHESALLAKFGTNLTDRAASIMREAKRGDAITHAGGYHGWVRMLFEVNGTRRHSMNLYYHHGAGGAPLMSHGVLDTRRVASWIDADVIVSGHTHTNYLLGLKRIRLSDGGLPYENTMDFVRTPGYKHRGGWEVERGHPPKPLGCVWMRLVYDAGVIRREFTASLH